MHALHAALRCLHMQEKQMGCQKTEGDILHALFLMAGKREVDKAPAHTTKTTANSHC
jgi:hypothetical protein